MGEHLELEEVCKVIFRVVNLVFPGCQQFYYKSKLQLKNSVYLLSEQSSRLFFYNFAGLQSFAIINHFVHILS